MISSHPKIFTLGTVYIKDILNEEVVVEEKIDGSMFAFAKIGGELHFRSKGAVLYEVNPTTMFKLGVDYIVSIKDKVPEGIIFYGEYLNKCKHNVLKYNRVPKNNIILFGAKALSEEFLPDYYKYANGLDLEVVPQLYRGKIDNIDELMKLLEIDSILGGTKIEGIVIKNYARPFLLGGSVPMPFMVGKFVSKEFKEVHQKEWKTEHSTNGKLEQFKDSFKTEARWHKAIQHLKENNELEGSPRDIGKLIKEVKEDIVLEEKENIKEWFWNHFNGDILRNSTRGLPEWYKKYLLES